MDLNTITLVISVIGSAVASTWKLSRSISDVESKLNSHISTYEKVNQLEKESIYGRIDRLDKHIHDLRNQIQSITLMVASGDKEHK